MSSGAHEAVAGRDRIAPIGGAHVRPRNKLSLTLRGEGRLAYALLSPTLLVILFLVAYPFCAAIYLSLHDKMVGAPAGGSASPTTRSSSATTSSCGRPGTASSTPWSPSP